MNTSTVRKLIIWGASGHALVVADIVRLTGRFTIAGFIDDLYPEKHNKPFCGATVLGGREQLEKVRAAGVEDLIVGVGDSAARLQLAAFARQKGFRLATAVHPGGIVAQDVLIGEGTVIAAGAIVNPGTKIGENVIINTGAIIDHECVVEDGSHVGPRACLGGKVIIGRSVWIGIGAMVKDHVVIGAGSIIGAGGVVLEDVPSGVVAYGVPAKVQRKIGSNGR